MEKIENLVPVGFRTLVNIYKKPRETSSGFILPENENSGMPTMAMISVLGCKTWVQHLQMILGLKPKYKVGQWVYFRKYSIDEMIIETPEGKINLYVLEDAEIIGLVNN
jgi:co-chaperonin GroES (HSP10)